MLVLRLIREQIVVLATMGVRIEEHRMDQGWRNYANTRMAPLTYIQSVPFPFKSWDIFKRRQRENSPKDI